MRYLEIIAVMIISNERSNCQWKMELQASTGSGVSSMAVKVEALELEVQLSSESFVLLIAQAVSLLLPGLFLFAHFIQFPDPRLTKITPPTSYLSICF